MDYKKLSKTTDSLSGRKISSTVIKDSLNRKHLKKSSLKDSLNRKPYRKFKLTDSYKNILKKIKDELEETETTEQAINVVLETLEELPAEQVLAATVEVLGQTIDVLEEHLNDVEDTDETEDFDDTEDTDETED